ncbi:MAG: hypothetical protein V4608_02900 [Bacteroidota bacterium]
MKKKKYITITLIGACCLFSCAPSAESEKIVAQDSIHLSDIQTMEMDFTTDTLNNEQVELFGKTAIQKLEDLYGYIEIFTNEKYDTTLREHAKSLAAEVFSDKQNIEPFMNSISTVISDSGSVSLSNSLIRSEAKITNDTIYSGVISFEEQFQKSTKKRTIGFIIKKTNKSFGQEQNVVWETYLSLINN